ncbi:MAG: restriction endonuclease subunit S, partial [Desulfatirhabdiaceae bacterium]
MNITGDSVARCCIVPEKALPARVNQHVAIIRSDKNKLNSLYLMYYLVSPYMQSLMLSFAGSGGTRKALTKTMIEGFGIPVPPLDTQNKIASILSAYDDLIKNNNRRIALLEESARQLYHEWFVRLRFPGHESTRITDGVPEGWESRPLGEICFQHKQSVKPSDIAPGTPYIGLAHIPRRSIILSDWDFADEINSNKFEFETGDILFGKIRPYFHKVGFTLCDGVTSSDAIVIRPYDEQHYSYLLMHVSSDMFVTLAS